MDPKTFFPWKHWIPIFQWWHFAITRQDIPRRRVHQDDHHASSCLSEYEIRECSVARLKSLHAQNQLSVKGHLETPPYLIMPPALLRNGRGRHRAEEMNALRTALDAHQLSLVWHRCGAPARFPANNVRSHVYIGGRIFHHATALRA